MASKQVKHNCLHCNKEFSVYLSWEIQRGGAKYCSNRCRGEASRGVPVNVGHPVSQEARDKIRAARLKQADPRLGKKHSDETRAKMSDTATRNAKFGAKNHMWKGGVTTKSRLERDRFRKTLQKKIFARDSWTCQICNVHDVNLHVDHIKGWAEYPELRFDMDNCRTLCIPCHYYVTFKRKMPHGYKWGPSYRQQGRTI